MTRRIHTIEMKAETFEQNRDSIRQDLIFCKPVKDKVVIAIWMTWLEAIKARKELLYFNIAHGNNQMKLRRGFITK